MNGIKERSAAWLTVWVLVFCLAAPLAQAEPKGTVVLFHAGSLSMPFEAMEKAFEARYPGVDLRREASGSQAAARKVTDLNRPCDIMASADFKVIDKLLIPGQADWNIRFATNQMVLCYTEKSRFAQELNAGNWHEILRRKGVVWGHADPNLDPCGYRSLMVLQLAEKHYGLPGLYEKMLANRPLANVRPKSVELISLLQTANMDYAWEYLSVAVQHGLKYLVLPDEINLSDYKKDPFYAQAVVKVTGKKPGEFMEMTGESITYGVTLIRNAPNREAAIAFLEYLLDPAGGMRILKEQGQPPFIPCRVASEPMKAALPPGLQKRVEAKE
ncbi:MAG: tungstate ABC transporter substrate-binding protein WtpA [Deltaproteobacteria bacterium]|nr:tungstate ABC transporter substrate-binding protein WtpA [Deltaproteobacteria bacterium]